MRLLGTPGGTSVVLRGLPERALGPPARRRRDAVVVARRSANRAPRALPPRRRTRSRSRSADPSPSHRAALVRAPPMQASVRRNRRTPDSRPGATLAGAAVMTPRARGVVAPRRRSASRPRSAGGSTGYSLLQSERLLRHPGAAPLRREPPLTCCCCTRAARGLTWCSRRGVQRRLGVAGVGLGSRGCASAASRRRPPGSHVAFSRSTSTTAEIHSARVRWSRPPTSPGSAGSRRAHTRPRWTLAAIGAIAVRSACTVRHGDQLAVVVLASVPGGALTTSRRSDGPDATGLALGCSAAAPGGVTSLVLRGSRRGSVAARDACRARTVVPARRLARRSSSSCRWSRDGRLPARSSLRGRPDCRGAAHSAARTP